ncbi:ATP-dependent nuclease [Aminobacterium colombiense]|uniref:Putative prophage Lp2 protein 4 n=1 Tax=Aminobacterium colombiense (strain DSM 12261 / ALA-1) TaxID=572547 RepID=D5EFD8_AMICL|nr:AAA family ATPase [Aminobacterium colombiense]ADE57270.1 putative prophage Lp2 protein 4 [Aminobacterium colombiense DSM 12261]
MVKQIDIRKYRKMEDLSLVFSQGINILSGTNGTCKTSLLHIVSNSFQEVNKGCPWVTDASCLTAIKKVNKLINPKIETLTKGDKTYNDPANQVKGTLFTVEYYDHPSLEFRKHNSKANNRYAIKPYYGKNRGDTLPFCPVIYLGLGRLFPFGEFQNDEAIRGVKGELPSTYQDEIKTFYEDFTGISIESSSPQQMGDFKTRADFISDVEGIDSNTISAGEDNLFILLTAIISLKYYYEATALSHEVTSILLVDEIDATLHPSILYKLLKLFEDYSNRYKIQIICTSHSLSLIEFALARKYNVIYLLDNIESVFNMETPDIYKIKMYLHNISENEIYLGKKIPVFTEDEEAKTFLKILFEYLAENEETQSFEAIRNYFHLVEACLGAKDLKNIFNDNYLLKSTLQSICILDGDQNGSAGMNQNIICLPGEKSPEKMAMTYAIQLYENNDSFFADNGTPVNLGYTRLYFRENILHDIGNIQTTINEHRAGGKSIHGVERALNKKVFSRHETFFNLIFRHWLHDDNNRAQILTFYDNLISMYKKTAPFHGLNPNKIERINALSRTR